MALTPQNLIDDAILDAYPYIRREAIAPGQLLRQLTALDSEVVGWFVTDAPHRLAQTASDMTILTATNVTGYALIAARAYVTFNYIDKDGYFYESPIRIVTEKEFAFPSYHPAGIVRTVAGVNTFFPADPYGKRWAGTEQRPFFIGDGDVISYRYIPEPARVTSLTQTLISPDEAQTYFQKALVLSLLLTSGTAPQERLVGAQQDVQMARQRLVLEAAKRSPVKASTRDSVAAGAR